MKRFSKLIVLMLIISILSTFLVYSVNATSIAHGAGTVTISALNVRSEPNTSSAIISTIHKDSIVVILDIPSSDWYHINYKGTDGYVASIYISDILNTENFNATGILTDNDIRVRSTASTAGDILGTYSEGKVMNIIGINSGWYKVQSGSVTGYIRSDLMKIIPDSSRRASALGQEIANFAKQYVGYSYIYGASSPSVGFDCSGLTYYVYGQFGYHISRTASQQYRNNGINVSKSELQPGDLVFFSSNGGRSITHVGLYYGDGNFVNASTTNVGVIFSSLDSSYYTRTYYGAKRII